MFAFNNTAPAALLSLALTGGCVDYSVGGKCPDGDTASSSTAGDSPTENGRVNPFRGEIDRGEANRLPAAPVLTRPSDCAGAQQVRWEGVEYVTLISPLLCFGEVRGEDPLARVSAWNWEGAFSGLDLNREEDRRILIAAPPPAGALYMSAMVWREDGSGTLSPTFSEELARLQGGAGDKLGAAFKAHMDREREEEMGDYENLTSAPPTKPEVVGTYYGGVGYLSAPAGEASSWPSGALLEVVVDLGNQATTWNVGNNPFVAEGTYLSVMMLRFGEPYGTPCEEWDEEVCASTREFVGWTARGEDPAIMRASAPLVLTPATNWSSVARNGDPDVE